MNVDISTIQPYVTLIKDILTGFAAVTAAVIGIVGLQTWKNQLRWKTEYELAQRLAKAVYKMRSVFAEAEMLMDRSPLRQYIEDAVSGRDTFAEYWHFQKPHLQNYWQELRTVSTELDGVFFEAEAIWGATVKTVLESLREDVRQLSLMFSTLVDILENPETGPDSKTFKNDWKSAFKIFGELDKKLRDDTQQAITTIEGVLTPYLKK
jgi:hypothetical protein